MPQNSYMGTSLNVGNKGCRSMIDVIMHFRTQVTRTDEIKSLGGWSDPLNMILADGLQRMREHLARVTDDPDARALLQKERQELKESEAKDETKKLEDLYNISNPFTSDDVQLPATNMSPLPYDFSGADKNYPQMSEPRFENVFLIQFVTELDYTVKDLSNLGCAEFGYVIPTDQSAMIHVHLETAFSILASQGGRANMPRIINGTDADDLTGKVGPDSVPATIEIPAPASDAVQSS